MRPSQAGSGGADPPCTPPRPLATDAVSVTELGIPEMDQLCVQALLVQFPTLHPVSKGEIPQAPGACPPLSTRPKSLTPPRQPPGG